MTVTPGADLPGILSPVGLLGGTFDPVHYGHLRLASEMAEALKLEQVRLLPAGTPPHRGVPSAEPGHRLAMCRLAINGNSRLRIDETEIHKTTPCYMVDTLRALRSGLGLTPIVLFMGADAFAGLTRWHDWQQLLQLCHIAVAERPGTQPAMPDELQKLQQDRLTDNSVDLHNAPAGRLYRHAITQLDISASRIRADLQSGRSPRYLLPDAVLDYIDQHHLYQ